MTINSTDGLFQACYWRDAARLEEACDAAEYSDFAMELKDRIQKLLRRREYAHAALFAWNAARGEWDLQEEFGRRDG